MKNVFPDKDNYEPRYAKSHQKNQVREVGSKKRYLKVLKIKNSQQTFKDCSKWTYLCVHLLMMWRCLPKVRRVYSWTWPYIKKKQKVFSTTFDRPLKSLTKPISQLFWANLMQNWVIQSLVRVLNLICICWSKKTIVSKEKIQ